MPNCGIIAQMTHEFCQQIYILTYDLRISCLAESFRLSGKIMYTSEGQVKLGYSMFNTVCKGLVLRCRLQKGLLGSLMRVIPSGSNANVPINQSHYYYSRNKDMVTHDKQVIHLINNNLKSLSQSFIQIIEIQEAAYSA